MEDLVCSVCSEMFEGGVRKPVVLPECGHTFCRPCLLNLQNTDPAFKCPTCRSPHSGPPVDNLPVVYVILNMLATYANLKAEARVPWEECQSHGDPIRLWCRPCHEPLCGQCLFEGHMTEGHHVVRTQTALDHEKQLLTSQAARVTKFIEDKRKQLTEEFHEVSHHLAKIYKQTKILTHYSKTVTDILQTTDETNQMKTLIMNRRLIDNLLEKLETSERNSCVSDRAARTVPASPVPEATDGARETCRHTPELMAVKDDDFETVAQDCGRDSDTDDDGTQESQEAGVNQRDGRDPQVSQDDGRDPQVSQDEGGDPQMRQDRGEMDEVERSEDPECPVWRLSLCAPGGTTHWPRINWYNFMAQLPVVQLLVPPEKPEVFLQLGVGERNLGRVHIRLWGHLRRAQHFLALCLGTLGPSYRGSTFSYVARKGEPGERLVGGVYLTEDGGSSSHQLIQCLEWRGEYLGPAMEGIVGGSRGRQAKYNSCFCISSRDNPIGQYYCPFGKVVSGLEVVRAAIQHDPVSDVTIMDAGLIVPHT